MRKDVVGLSLTVAPGEVTIGGKHVEVRPSALAFGIDRWGNWRLSSVEAALPWWRRALVNLAYWHRTPRPPKPDTRTYDDGWDELDYDEDAESV